MTDLVLVELVKTAFWASAFGLVVILFRAEFRILLRSMGAFNFAGASFTLRDRRQTLESYALLSDVFVDLLSKSDSIEKFLPLLSPSQTEKLGQFAIRFTQEAEEGSWNEEMLRNVAVLLFRSDRRAQSTELYEALLKRRPNNMDLLNLKALSLLVSRLPDLSKQALEILEPLSKRYPDNAPIRFNLACAKSTCGDHAGAMQELYQLSESGHFLKEPHWLDDSLLYYTRSEMKKEFGELRQSAIMKL